MFASTERCVVDAHKKHIGDVKKKAVREIEEGTFIHLAPGGKATVVRFPVPEKKKAWSWLDKDYDDAGFKKTKSSYFRDDPPSKNETLINRMLTQQVDWMNCDVCNVEYHADRMENVVDQGDHLVLCPVCYDWLNDTLEDEGQVDANPLDVRFSV
jgi:hypothetical protein